MLGELELVVIGILIARPLAGPAEISDLLGIEVEAAEKRLARLEMKRAILQRIIHGRRCGPVDDPPSDESST